MKQSLTQRQSFALQTLSRKRQKAKAAVQNAVRKRRISPQTRLRLEFDLRPRNYESHALTTQQRTLNTSQTLATNETENRCFEIANATDRDYCKIAISGIDYKFVNIFIENFYLEKKLLIITTRTATSL